MAFLDQDRDGNINLNEYSQREVSNFNRFDTDQDGIITTVSQTSDVTIYKASITITNQRTEKVSSCLFDILS